MRLFDYASFSAIVEPAGATGYTLLWSDGDNSVGLIEDQTGGLFAWETGTATVICTVVNSDGSRVTSKPYTVTVSANT
ncbi:Ig-like domain-containing protein [Cronobacter malonaticus]|uniref:Ig-like domain-containing protein n=1 Tax=Cronobacter malonaticus TaxID=413503 RepID=UPI003D15898F